MNRWNQSIYWVFEWFILLLKTIPCNLNVLYICFVCFFLTNSKLLYFCMKFVQKCCSTSCRSRNYLNVSPTTNCISMQLYCMWSRPSRRQRCAILWFLKFGANNCLLEHVLFALQFNYLWLVIRYSILFTFIRWYLNIPLSYLFDFVRILLYFIGVTPLFSLIYSTLCLFFFIL